MESTVSTPLDMSLDHPYAHLAAEVLDLDRAALEGHREAAL